MKSIAVSVIANLAFLVFAEGAVHHDHEIARVTIPRGAPIADNRILRDAKGCNFPDSLKTAEISCTLYETKVKCTIKCVWGHKFSEGNEKTITCRYREDRWKPSGFEECEPYVDCSLEMVSPGDLHCVSNEVDRPAYCDVTCDEYDETPAVSRRKYECKLDGNWEPPLPFCVKQKSKL